MVPPSFSTPGKDVRREQRTSETISAVMDNDSSSEEVTDDETKDDDGSTDMDKEVNDSMHSDNDTDDSDDNSSQSSRELENDDSNAKVVDTGIVVAAPEVIEYINRACTGKSATYAHSPKIVI